MKPTTLFLCAVVIIVTVWRFKSNDINITIISYIAATPADNTVLFITLLGISHAAGTNEHRKIIFVVVSIHQINSPLFYFYSATM